MNQTLFRQTSLERISSPEQLDSYIRVSNPSVWLILAAVIVLLVSVCVWGFFGHMETKVETMALVRDGQAVLLLTQEQKQTVAPGQILRIDKTEGSVGTVSEEPASFNALAGPLSEYERDAFGLQEGEWRYQAQAEIEVADGVYQAEIVVESVSPLSFILN